MDGQRRAFGAQGCQPVKSDSGPTEKGESDMGQVERVANPAKRSLYRSLALQQIRKLRAEESTQETKVSTLAQKQYAEATSARVASGPTSQGAAGYPPRRMAAGAAAAGSEPSFFAAKLATLLPAERISPLCRLQGSFCG